MKLVSEVFGTLITTVSIIDAEKTTIRPVFNVLLVLGPDDIEDDRDAIFVVMTHQSCVGVGSIAVNAVILVFAVLRRVDVGNFIEIDGRLGFKLQRRYFLDFFLLKSTGVRVI